MNLFQLENNILIGSWFILLVKSEAFETRNDSENEWTKRKKL